MLGWEGPWAINQSHKPVTSVCATLSLSQNSGCQMGLANLVPKFLLDVVATAWSLGIDVYRL